MGPITRHFEIPDLLRRGYARAYPVIQLIRSGNARRLRVYLDAAGKRELEDMVAEMRRQDEDFRQHLIAEVIPVVVAAAFREGGGNAGALAYLREREGVFRGLGVVREVNIEYRKQKLSHEIQNRT